MPQTLQRINMSPSSQFIICSVDDYQEEAKRRLDKALYEYLASGTEDEQTLSENRVAFKEWFLRPRVLRPVGSLTTRTCLVFSSKNTPSMMRMPVFVSPAGVHALCHKEGECATARVCQEFNIPFGLSQHSTRTIEEVRAAAPGGVMWYQAYILKDRSITESLIRRAIANSYTAIVWTVDSVRFGYREADHRNGFDALPEPHRLVNYDGVVSEGTIAPLPGSSRSSSNTRLEDTYNGKVHQSWDQNSELMFDPNCSWKDLQWLKGFGLPVIVKGIMTAEDASLAVAHGADGIIVSNHGGRQIDGCLGSIDALPEVAKAVNKRIPIFLDGGIRRGTDILKALSLGATAVGIGKPVFFGLAVDGENGVKNILQILQRELESAMALCGLSRVDGVQRDVVTRHPNPSRSTYVRAKL